MHSEMAAASMTRSPRLSTSLYPRRGMSTASPSDTGSAVNKPSTLVPFMRISAPISLARNAAAESVENPGAVWDDNFVGVWHLNQEQAGTDQHEQQPQPGNHRGDLHGLGLRTREHAEHGGDQAEAPLARDADLQHRRQRFERALHVLRDALKRALRSVARKRDDRAARLRDGYPEGAGQALADAERLRSFDPLGLMMIEQPLGSEDLREHAILQSSMKTPLCLDESIRSPGDALLALELGSGRIINIKPARVGGITAWKDAGLPMAAP